MFLPNFPENIDDEFKIALLSLLLNFKYDSTSAIFHRLTAVNEKDIKMMHLN